MRTEIAQMRIRVKERHVATEKILSTFHGRASRTLAEWKVYFARNGTLDSSMWEGKQREFETLIEVTQALRQQASHSLGSLQGLGAEELEGRLVQMASFLAQAENLETNLKPPPAIR
ncbi:hypothetical protein [Gemmobacter sp. 24YEA27]|uniref:hypothetical protein n=1 Tax=Gemmobacter sp. 24YEA27 TaxID=3040672 RepID=UPI0024B39733|nr:hypothetical protein [Gemmobacter sp. 24YEA27]